MEFHALTIKEVRRETADCVSLLFDIPEHLRPAFRYEPGQYLTVRTLLDGEEVRRSYSICTIPADGEWRVAVKKVAGGRFSTFANERLRAGDALEVAAPAGRFSPHLSPENRKNYALFAGGSGITPILSVLRSILETEPRSRVQLFYGNQRTDTVIFLEAIEGLKNRFPTRLAIYHVFDKESQEEPILNGFLNGEKLHAMAGRIFFPGVLDEAFICGPEPMMHALRAGLTELGIAPEKIHIELFGSSQSAAAPRPPAAAVEAAQTGKTCAVTVKLDGRSTRFDLPFGTESILDAAMRKTPGLPYACKGGVCCTCKARLVEGQVSMAVNYGLEPEEIAQGFVLTCQSFPLTETVVIDYD